LQELPALVKRTALATFPRQTVASLSSTAWLEFLDHTGHTKAFTHGRGQLLPVLSYDPHAASRLNAQDIAELFSVVSDWMRHHTQTATAL
jgi:Ca-activated chloride channel family protein